MRAAAWSACFLVAVWTLAARPLAAAVGRAPLPGAVILSGLPEDIPWWNGCSPTAAAMLFGYWEEHGCDAFPGSHRNLPANYPATSSNPAHYSDARGVIAGWAHKQAGISLGYDYGSFQNHAPDSLADFLRTDDASTSRLDIAHGLATFAAWDDPRTAAIESRRFAAATYTGLGWNFAAYKAEIDAGRPVHVGLLSTAGGHSVLGVGYNDTGGKQDIVLLSTWGWGLQEWEWTNETVTGYNFKVYAGTTLTPAADPVPGLSAYLSIAHTYIGDLTVELGVGDPANPTWTKTVWTRGGGGADHLVLTDIDVTDQETAFLHGPLDWYLKVTDSVAGAYTGSILDFQIRYGFDQRVFDYVGPPVAINNNQTSYVYLHTTPEPATLLLLLAGVGLVLARRKRLLTE